MTSTIKPFELHRLASKGGTLKGAGWAGRIQQVLDAGELANELDEHDRTPLGVLVEQGCCDHDAAAVASALIRGGANPLIHDRAMGRVAADVFIGGDSRLAEAMATAVINLEETVRPRSETGETLLHVLCADAPESVSDFVSSAGWYSVARGRDISSRWVNERDEEGQTPLHAMWARGGVIFDRLEAGMDVDGHETAWNGMVDLLDIGANLLARDNKGVPVANRILECVEMGFPVDNNDPHWAVIQASATRELMQGKTDHPQSKPGPQVRI